MRTRRRPSRGGGGRTFGGRAAKREPRATFVEMNNARRLATDVVERREHTQSRVSGSATRRGGGRYPNPLAFFFRTVGRFRELGTVDFHFSSNWSSSWCVNARFPQFPRPCSPRSWARAGNLGHIRPRARRASSSPGSVNAPRREPCPPPPPSSAADWGSACRCTSTPCASSPSFAVRHRPPPPEPRSARFRVCLSLARDAPRGLPRAARAVPRVTHPHPSVARARPPPTLAEPERPADPIPKNRSPTDPWEHVFWTGAGVAFANWNSSGRRSCARRWTRSTPSVEANNARFMESIVKGESK